MQFLKTCLLVLKTVFLFCDNYTTMAYFTQVDTRALALDKKSDNVNDLITFFLLDMEVRFTSSNSIDSLGMGNDDEILIRSSKEFTIDKYRYRWFILALYSSTAFSNTLVWLSLFTVTDATSIFYDVKEEHLIWSSAASTVIQCFIAIPFSFLPSRLGLRTSMVIAAAINATGACVMVAGAHRGGFAYFIAGQAVVAVAASLLPQLAPEVSAVWFGKNEQAISTSIGITVGNAGAAFGFLQPALFLRGIDPEVDIIQLSQKIKQVIYVQAGLCVFLLIVVFVFFKQRPAKPPSVSQAIRPGPGSINFQEFKKSCKDIMTSCHYHMAANAFALMNMITFVVPVVLNQIMNWKFPHQDSIFGWMGFGGIVSGIIGSVIFSLILDKTKSFKVLSIVIALVSVGMWVLFVESLARVSALWVPVLVFIVALFLFIPLSPILVETMIEITYPVPESISFAVAITGARLYSLPVTFLAGYMVEKKMYYGVAHMFTGVVILCLLLVLVMKVDRKRMLAELESNTVLDEQFMINGPVIIEDINEDPEEDNY